MSLLEAVQAPAEKMTITKIDDPRTQFTPQFNPTEFTEKLGVTWARKTVIGQSHKVLHYINTENNGFEFSLFFDARTREQAERNLIARKFLQAICFPRRVMAGNTPGGAPPRLLFIWPQMISLTAVIDSVEFTYTQFAATGLPISFIARVVLEEIRDFRLHVDDVLNDGTIRGSEDEGEL